MKFEPGLFFQNTILVKELIDSTHESIVIIDDDDAIVYLNPSAEQIFRTPAAEIMGQKLYQIIPEREKEHHLWFLQQYRADKLHLMKNIERERVARRKDGSEFSLNVRLLPTQVHGRTYYIGLIKDLTAEKELEHERNLAYEELSRCASFASLGLMSSYMAHEVNNPLAMIYAFLGKLKDQNTSQDVKNKLLEQMSMAADRMRRVLVSFMDTARGGCSEKSEIEINKIIKSVACFHVEDLRLHKIEVKFELTREALLFLGITTEIESIFFNLLTNARDAFESIKDSRNRLIEITSKMDNSRNIEIKFKDNAGGMPEDVARRITEPFFTTKAKGKGMGIGMALVNQIISKNGGTLKINSDPGIGTEFIITLPSFIKTDSQPKMRESVSAAKPKRDRSKEVPDVLVIDDDLEVAHALQFLIEDKFNVHIHHHVGKVELQSIIAGKKIDLIICDFVLSKTTGLELVKEQKKENPNLAFAIMTGFPLQEDIVKEFQALGINTFIEKPFPSSEELIGILNRELGIS